jgi:hypothetical protein
MRKKYNYFILFLTMIVAFQILATQNRPIDKKHSNQQSHCNACEKQKCELAKYQIGDIGPEDGIIFYINNHADLNFRYMEVTTKDYDMLEWGAYKARVRADNEYVGTGAQNTKKINDFLYRSVDEEFNVLKNKHEKPRAAQVIMTENFRGKDWVLPSKDELNSIYINLIKNQNVDNNEVGFKTTTPYWSSTEYNDDMAYAQKFNGDDAKKTRKNEKCLVRLIRYFPNENR